MNLSLPDHLNMHNSSDRCLEDNKTEVTLPCFRRNLYNEPLTTYSNGSFISQLLRKTIHSKRALDERHSYLSNSTAGDSGQEDQSSVSSKDSTVEADSPSDRGGSPEDEPTVMDHVQAKRARVENIIRVMAGSPNGRQHGDNERSDIDSSEVREGRELFRENKRKQRLPQHQEHGAALGSTKQKAAGGGNSCTKEEECHKLKEQLQSMQQLLRQLQEKFLQVYSQDDAEYEDRDGAELYPEHEVLRGHREARYMSSEEDLERSEAADCKRFEAVGYLVHQREGQNLQETLKHELSKAVNECVDKVFKKVSPTGLDVSPQQRMCSTPEMETSASAERKSSTLDLSQSEELTPKSAPLEYQETMEAQSPQDQTEALSLVVRKPAPSPVNSIAPAVKRPYPVHQTPFQFNYTSPLHESHILEHLLKYGPHPSFGTLPCMPPVMDRASPDSADLSWEAVAMRSKVASSHFGHHARHSSMGSVAVDNLCLPHVKIEGGELQSMAERNPYMSLNISFPIK